ncbi:MAG: preprotein translocase subunit SecY [Candidatus Bathyarchaeota archaeon]|nr:MAG: preprotein translocase subunit SecY [Candidatus Bathyarchaeota archaeon]
MARFLDIFRPIARFMPEVTPPERRVSFNEKLFWTGLVLILYLIMSEIPLYGIPLYSQGVGYDPLLYMRVILAARRGTLMELGIGPIVTAGLILQLLAGSGLLQIDFSIPEDRALFTGANKFFAIIMVIFQALAYILGGAYGSIKPDIAFLICIQLVAAGVVLMLLDELVQKGWGIGSGISLFIAAGVAQQIWWLSLGPVGPMSDEKYFGALVAFSQAIMAREYENGWWGVIHRPDNLPDMIGFLSMLIVFFVAIYFQGVRIEIPISFARYRGYRSKYPVQLLYVSNIPVILTSALFADIYFVAQILWSRFNRDGSSVWLNLLGSFSQSGAVPTPTGGLAYFVTPPRSLELVGEDPVRALVYVTLLIAFCVIFSVTWLEVGGVDAKTVAGQLLSSGVQVPGFRRSERPIRRILDRYIPSVTIVGGVVVGCLAAFGDMLNSFGTGTGILLTSGIFFQYYQQLVQERVVEMYPAFRDFLGK